MANVKITELSALTTPADADSMVIVDDSEASLEQTKLITYANLKAALTGAGTTYGTTGAYTASFPTNGVAASSIIMLGTSNTIIWMYLNAAPPGWKALSTGADTVLGVSGGAASFNVNGGNPDSAATWTIAGLTHSHTHVGPYHYHSGPSHTHTGPSHTHTGPSHTHTVDIPIAGYGGASEVGLRAGYIQTDNTGNHYYATTSPTATSSASGTGATGAEGTGATGASGTGSTGYAGNGSTGDATGGLGTTVSSAGTWRPKASIGKLFQLDTA